MAISYSELAVISNMTDDELREEHNELIDRTPLNEDGKDTINAILSEMESRGLQRP